MDNGVQRRRDSRAAPCPPESARSARPAVKPEGRPGETDGQYIERLREEVLELRIRHARLSDALWNVANLSGAALRRDLDSGSAPPST